MPIQKLRHLLKLLVFVCLLTTTSFAVAKSEYSSAEFQRWQQQEARNVTITRDDWGIAHVVGKTDADAVFGAIYA